MSKRTKNNVNFTMTWWENIIHRIQTQHWNSHWFQSTIRAGISIIIINCLVSKHDWGESLIKLSDGFSLKHKKRWSLFLDSEEEIKILHNVSLLPSWRDPCRFVSQTYAGACSKIISKVKKFQVIAISITPPQVPN